MSTKQSKVKKQPSTPSKRTAKEDDKAVNIVTPVATKPQRKLTVTPKKQRVPLIGDEVDDQQSENLDTSNIVSPSKPVKSTVHVDSKVELVYKIVKKTTGALGGNGATGAIYGELTTRALQRVFNIMVEKCNMSSTSRMIDVGAGLGKPNFHAAQDPAVRLSLGAELEDIRWKVRYYLPRLFAGLATYCRIALFS
jgi:hypothetical protein